jgi:GTP pyrophosphokinase
VVTQKARSRIKHLFKTEERKQSIELGKTLVEEELRKHSLSPSLLASKEIEDVASGYNLKSLDDLFASVGYGKISAHQVINRLQPEKAALKPPPKRARKKPKEMKGITIKGIDDVLYHTAKCCFPVPGDELLGFITRGKGVAVHRRGCRNLERLAVDEARLIEVQWQPSDEVSAYARVVLETVDKPGIIANLSTLVSSAGVNISHLEATTSTQDRRARIVFILEVRDRNQLTGILHKVTQVDGILKVTRY